MHVKGSEVQINLRKSKHTVWTRLLKTKEKVRLTCAFSDCINYCRIQNFMAWLFKRIASCKDLDWIKVVVSKETVVLRRWGSSIQKFGFINGVDNVNWPPYRDSKIWIVLFGK